MKVDQLAFPTDKFPCFGFPVCVDSAKRFLPEYDDTDTVNGFEEIVFETMYLFKCNEAYEINMGDDRIYAYMFDRHTFVLGTREQILPNLRKALNNIQNAPFSKLEIAEFMNMNDTTMRTILDECFAFLSKIDIEQAEQWALEKSYYLRTGSHTGKERIRQIVRYIKTNPKLTYSILCTFSVAIAAVLGGIALFILHWDALFITLVSFVVIDYIVGLVKATLFKELSISASLQGLIRHLCVFAFVAIGAIVDRIVPEANGAIRSAMIIFFIAERGLGILGNAGVVGLPLPKSLKFALKKLRNSSSSANSESAKSEEEDKTNKNGT